MKDYTIKEILNIIDDIENLTDLEEIKKDYFKNSLITNDDRELELIKRLEVFTLKKLSTEIIENIIIFSINNDYYVGVDGDIDLFYLFYLKCNEIEITQTNETDSFWNILRDYSFYKSSFQAIQNDIEDLYSTIKDNRYCFHINDIKIFMKSELYKYIILSNLSIKIDINNVKKRNILKKDYKKNINNNNNKEQ